MRWADDACYRLGAALAYYALFSIFPLMLLSTTAVGFLLGNGDRARARVLNAFPSPSPELRALLDQTLQSMQIHRTARGVGAAIGLFALMLGASAVFSELEWSFDVIWRIQSPAVEGIWQRLQRAVRSKILSFAVVAFAAAAVLASLAVGTALHAMGNSSRQSSTGGFAWQIVEIAVSIAFLAGLFAAVFRIVPKANVEWRDVLGAGLVTSLLFVALKSGLAWYLARLGAYAAYGAVGAVLGLLTWIYVAGLIVLYGAEFARVYAERYGSLAKHDLR